MLGDHLHGLVVGDPRVERVTQSLQVYLELLPDTSIVPDKRSYPLYMALGDPCDVFRPFVPIDTRAAFLDELRLDGLLPTLNRIEREAHLHAFCDFGGFSLLSLFSAL